MLSRHGCFCAFDCAFYLFHESPASTLKAKARQQNSPQFIERLHEEMGREQSQQHGGYTNSHHEQNSAFLALQFRFGNNVREGNDQLSISDRSEITTSTNGFVN